MKRKAKPRKRKRQENGGNMGIVMKNTLEKDKNLRQKSVLILKNMKKSGEHQLRKNPKREWSQS
jgi:hypothetical protein